MAFDAGNLKAVAQGLHECYSNIPIVIAADDDKPLELTTPKRINPGKEKALEAAAAVNGYIIVPVFAPGEQQENPRKFTDFNDLAKNSILGIDGVKRQTKHAVNELIRNLRGIRQVRTSKPAQPI